MQKLNPNCFNGSFLTSKLIKLIKHVPSSQVLLPLLLKSHAEPNICTSPEAELVHGDGEVSRLVVAVVEVAVVHRDQVHVAEDEAVVLSVFQSFRVANIQQLGSVESVLTQLQDKTPERWLFHCCIQWTRREVGCELHQITNSMTFVSMAALRLQ